ncbi:hypothetical protein D3C78_1442870 [compost metagenome]
MRNWLQDTASILVGKRDLLGHVFVHEMTLFEAHDHLVDVVVTVLLQIITHQELVGQREYISQLDSVSEPKAQFGCAGQFAHRGRKQTTTLRLTGGFIATDNARWQELIG